MVKKKSSSELLFLTFIGEKVVLTSTFKITDTVDSEEGVHQIELPLMLDGYLMDMDDEYYYLGEDPKSVSKAVRKDQILSIEIESMKTVYDQILDEMDSPIEDTDIN